MKVVLSLVLALWLQGCHAGPQVAVQGITYAGSSIHGVDFFGGIPFAEPPIGNLRLRKPEAFKPSRNAPSPVDATEFGLSCPQLDITPTAQSESCLTVNIFRPAGTSEHSRLPVMTWVYGGGFTEGAASIYNGSGIVAQSIIRGTPIIYVNLNYRLGPLGWPLGEEAESDDVLNLGLEDQLLAFRWVQANIRLFGGDPDKVTIFGESAGAISVALHFLNPSADNVFRAAILESGSQSTNQIVKATDRQSVWDSFATAAGCPGSTTLTCLRNANLSAILLGQHVAQTNSSIEFPFGPMIDHQLIPESPAELLSAGKFLAKPFISGTNLDEGTAFTPHALASVADLELFLLALYNPETSSDDAAITAELLQLYPDMNSEFSSPYGTGAAPNPGFGAEFKRGASILGDLAFLALRRDFIDKSTTHKHTRSYAYLFADAEAVVPDLGVTHGTEIVYVYRDVATLAQAGQTLSAQMADYWIAFANKLDPNDGKGTERPEWVPWDASKPMVMQLSGGNTTLIPDTFRKQQTDFINSKPIPLAHRRRGL